MSRVWERLRPRLLACADFTVDAGADALAWVATTTRRWPLAASLVEVALFGLLSYALLDRPLALWFKAHLGAETSGFFKVMSLLGLGGLYLIPSGLLWLFCRWRAARSAYFYQEQRYRAFANASLYVFLTLAVSSLAVRLIKFAAGRLRPQMLFEQGLYGFDPMSFNWAMNSLPSGHSQVAFAAMTALAIVIPRYDLAWLAVALLVAAGRVVTSVHYLSDAVIGSYIGVASAILVYRAFAARGVGVRLHFARDRAIAE